MFTSLTLNYRLGIEIEQREKLDRQLRELSIRDGLTGLYNRRHFDTAYTEELKRAERARTEFSIVLVDIDCFKQFNDTYGHPAGDDCLRRVSKAIAQSMNRPGDLVARYGGEEIAALLPNTNAEQAFHVAERIRIGVQELAIPHRGSTVSNSDTVTVSIGVATLGSDARSKEMDLLKKADQALYRAKANGRNRTVA